RKLECARKGSAGSGPVPLGTRKLEFAPKCFARRPREFLFGLAHAKRVKFPFKADGRRAFSKETVSDRAPAKFLRDLTMAAEATPLQTKIPPHKHVRGYDRGY
ncbi:MAG: hypothetical protein K2K83_03660, partial [Rikenella sp.]|nr:hypothetical protein [Rikenella sp.]